MPSASAPIVAFSSPSDELRLAVSAAASAAASDGGSGEPPPPSKAVLSDGEEALKASLPGSVLVMNDDSFCITGIESCWGSRHAGSAIKDISVQQKVGGSYKYMRDSWLTGNVKAVYLGVLTIESDRGASAGDLFVHGQVASVRLVKDPSGGDAISHLQVTVEGSVPKTSALEAALASVGAKRRLFCGGQLPPSLLSGGSVPTPAAAAGTVIACSEVSSGPAVTVLLGAHLQMVGLYTSGGAHECKCEELATFLCGIVGSPRFKGAITLILACTTATIGSGPPGRIAAAVQQRSALLIVVTRFVLGIPARALECAAAKLAALATSGYPLGVGFGGNVVAQALAETALPTRQPGGSPLAGLVHPLAPAAGGGAPPIASPDTSTLSPESALVAVIAARQAALDAIRAAKGGAVITAAPVALSGLDFLRPAIVAPAHAALTDLEVIDGLGGEDIARRIMAAAGNPAPLVKMTGPGSVAMSREVASDFGRLHAEVTSSFSDGEAAGAPFLITTPPADIDDAGTRLRLVLRQLHDLRRVNPSRVGVHTPEPALHLQMRQRAADRVVKPLPANATAERQFRSCGAALLEPLCTDHVARLANRFAASGDKLTEVQRVTSLGGRAVVGFITSSAEVDGETTSDPAAAIVAARTGLVAYIQRWLEEVATPQRARSVATETLALRSDIICLDLNWTRLQIRCGGLPPKGEQWMSGRPQLAAEESIVGRWGTMSGPLSYGDCERTARVFGPMLVLMHVDVSGGPPPGDPTCGLLALVQASATLGDAERTALLQEALERLAQQHQRRRVDPDAKPADPEAIFLDARLNAVQAISDASASARAGAAAGAAAAAAAMASFTAAVGKGTSRKAPADPPATPPDPAGTDGKGADGKKRVREERRKENKKRAAALVDLTTGTASTALVVDPAAAATAVAATAARAALSKSFAPPVKFEPFAAGEPAAGSISKVLDKAGGGLVEILDRLHFAEIGTDALPCGWFAALGRCRDHEDPKATCRKCTGGLPAMPAVLSRAKAALHADLKLPAASPVLKAA